jgi:hypothetical protein
MGMKAGLSYSNLRKIASRLMDRLERRDLGSCANTYHGLGGASPDNGSTSEIERGSSVTRLEAGDRIFVDLSSTFDGVAWRPALIKARRCGH